jgi:hypothetical protein
MSKELTIALALLCFTTASALGKETEPTPASAPDAKDFEPHATGKPVTTTKIKRCPEGYEFVTRANGQPGCAKDIVPIND